MAVVAAVAAVVSAGASIASGVISASASNKAAKAQQRLQALQAQQRRTAAIREARQRRGRIVNIASQTGAQGSSAELGARGSIQSQTATNLSFLDQSLGIAQTISEQQRRAAAVQSIVGAIGSVAKAAGNKQVQNLFT